MSTAVRILLIGILASGAIARAQEPEQRSRTPRSGDEVVVKGCLKGNMLEASDTAFADGTGSTSTPYDFQLKGKKDLLKRLRTEHDGTYVELSGRLRSSLDVPRGTRIGRTGIFIGPGGGPHDRPGDHDRIMPVLDVRSFAGTGSRCRR